MDEKNETRIDGDARGGRPKAPVALIPLMGGCLTFALATVAILVGLLIDLRLGTTPRWTLIILIGSAPLALGGVYFFVRRYLGRLRAEQELPKNDDA
ncbi:MAG: hypothetical protein ACNA70_02160 [Brevefilum sp.]